MATQLQIQQGESAQNTLPATRTIPDELQGFTLNLDATSTVKDARFILSFDVAGRPSIDSVPEDASVMTIDQLLKAINEPNGRYIETSVLADFAIATMERLKGRDSRIGDMLKELAVTL